MKHVFGKDSYWYVRSRYSHWYWSGVIEADKLMPEAEDAIKEAKKFNEKGWRDARSLAYAQVYDYCATDDKAETEENISDCIKEALEDPVILFTNGNEMYVCKMTYEEQTRGYIDTQLYGSFDLNSKTALKKAVQKQYGVVPLNIGFAGVLYVRNTNCSDSLSFPNESLFVCTKWTGELRPIYLSAEYECEDNGTVLQFEKIPLNRLDEGDNEKKLGPSMMAAVDLDCKNYLTWANVLKAIGADVV